ncbi:alpha-L-rhamnosidase N-terminal domain-containing protein [Urechidicola vernalis]|uniref:Alpha-L-rhamnosidase N-terminal domain-containing protein n=1 Tax=Urechidicola vernalis TaxID=3075600 RepID=A0ABU2Y0W8_9FLAO|nr:alpha-L-rhamnosidase N-terminal domain-containing protein [Urechidicola sp. P050]MDT0551829.1 alpha-L-rhamnosidase N-terminal domain-containing protein [Urechidicola sp. P050]
MHLNNSLSSLQHPLGLKILCAALLIVGCFSSLNAQNSELPYGVQGIWKLPNASEEPDFNWQAHWIWLPKNNEATLMLARKSFELDEVPQKALLRLTASYKYELVINNKSINQGPARSAPHHQSFDILDVSSVLVKGKNTIAIKVHFQNSKFSYHQKGRAGLLAQLNMAAKVLQTDNTWKVLADPTWNFQEDLMSRFQMDVNDQVDFRKDIGNWTAIDFDDSSWKQAAPLKRNDGWPAPKKSDPPSTFINPWISLIPRDIPYLIEDYVEAPSIVKRQSLSMNEFNNLMSNKGLKIELDKPTESVFPLRVSSSNMHNFILYDFGTVQNGMPKLEIKGKEGSKIHILSAPYMVNDVFSQHIIASKYHDQIRLSGKQDKWQALYFKPTRYLAVLIENNSEVEISKVGVHTIKYPFSLKGSIHIPEATWLEDLWKASAKTIDVATTDAYTDNYRERRQYAQTGYYAALGNYFTFGDHSLQRRYLIQTAQEQEPNGLMPAYAPLAKEDYMVILDSNCLWIRSLYNYYLYSGDELTVRQLLPNAIELMELLHGFTNEYGMIDNPPYAYWLDHTLNDRTGANTNLNGHYLGALKDFKKILEWLGYNDEMKYQSRAELLAASLQSNLWNEEKGLFSDAFKNGEQSTQFSEHANAMMLAEDVATDVQAKRVITQLLQKDNHNFIKRANGVTMVSPAMSYFLHKGIANYGYEAQSLEMLYNRFKHMLNPSTNQTLWEEWWLDGTGRSGTFVGGRTRSDAQTESVFPPALIAEFVFGLKPIVPGMKIISLEKPDTSLKTIEGAFPTPKGSLTIKWNLTGSSELEISIPKNTKVLLDLESLNSKRIKTNGKFIAEETQLMLNSGAYKIEF